MATIKIKRTNDYLNYFRDYRLFIDGHKIGTIGNGQTKDFEITEGKHNVVAKIDWCSSPELTFEINVNGSKTFLVGGLKNGRWIMPLIMIVITLTLVLPPPIHTLMVYVSVEHQ